MKEGSDDEEKKQLIPEPVQNIIEE